MILRTISERTGGGAPGEVAALRRESELELAREGFKPMPDIAPFLRTIIASLVYSLIGILLFGVCFWIISKVSPFSIRKELEEDQNTALAIVIGSIIIGLGLIISAAIHG